MDLNFMFTRQDQTLPNCMEVFKQVQELGLRHMGFKDLGVERTTLDELNKRIQGSGALSYLEIVATDQESCVAALERAMELGVDRVMGGVGAENLLERLAGSGVEYLPFPGRPEGHPTSLAGSPEDVARDCERFAAMGCAGVDLLAFRATQADPLELIRQARAATPGHLLVAGSVDSPERVRSLAALGVDSFTVGTAAFEETFAPDTPGVVAQIQCILDVLAELES